MKVSQQQLPLTTFLRDQPFDHVLTWPQRRYKSENRPERLYNKYNKKEKC